MPLMRNIRFLKSEFREHRTRTIVTFLVLILTWIPTWRMMNPIVGGKHFEDGMHGSAFLALVETACLLGGPLSIGAGIYNWDWYYTSEKGHPYVNLLGRTGTRIFYFIIGFLLSLVALIGLILPAIGYLLLFQDLLHR